MTLQNNLTLRYIPDMPCAPLQDGVKFIGKEILKISGINTKSLSCVKNFFGERLTLKREPEVNIINKRTHSHGSIRKKTE